MSLAEIHLDIPRELGVVHGLQIIDQPIYFAALVDFHKSVIRIYRHGHLCNRKWWCQVAFARNLVRWLDSICLLPALSKWARAMRIRKRLQGRFLVLGDYETCINSILIETPLDL